MEVEVVTIDMSAPSFVVMSVGSWIVILGTAITFGPQEVYAIGSPYPLVGGLRLTILPAATIAAVKLSGYIAMTAGLLLVAAAVTRRAVARQRDQFTG